MILYIEASAGVSGDMLLAALLDLGLPLSKLQRVLRQAGLGSVRVRTERVTRDDVSAMRLVIASRDRHPETAKQSKDLKTRFFGPSGLRMTANLPHRAADIIQLISQSGLKPSLQKKVLHVLRLLAHGEGQSHHLPAGRVVFHQLAGVDTLVNLIGFCLGLDHFNVRAVHTSPIPMGRFHRGHHGQPVHRPGPTAQRLLKRLPVVWRPEAFEWTTPTGAALLAAFASPKPLPPLKIVGIGHSVGHGRPPRGPSVFRLLLGKEALGV